MNWAILILVVLIFIRTCDTYRRVTMIGDRIFATPQVQCLQEKQTFSLKWAGGKDFVFVHEIVPDYETGDLFIHVRKVK